MSILCYVSNKLSVGSQVSVHVHGPMPRGIPHQNYKTVITQVDPTGECCTVAGDGDIGDVILYKHEVTCLE